MSQHPMIHFPTNSGASELMSAAEHVSEWMSITECPSEASELCKQMSKRTCVYIEIFGRDSWLLWSIVSRRNLFFYPLSLSRSQMVRQMALSPKISSIFFSVSVFHFRFVASPKIIEWRRVNGVHAVMRKRNVRVRDGSSADHFDVYSVFCSILCSSLCYPASQLFRPDCDTRFFYPNLYVAIFVKQQ